MLLLSVLTILAYSQLVYCGFISYDDSVYVIDNDFIKQGFNLDSIRWALTTRTDGNWFPLTWLSYMLDIAIAGSEPRVFHVSNLVYHLLSTCLLFVALYLMTGRSTRSAVVAALFALHPLHVESVAWVSERKDLLSAFFLMLTLIAYLKYVQKRTILTYVITLILFACGLMSKPMLVSLPLLLLLLDYWPLNRINTFSFKSFGKIVAEKIPFVVFSLASSVITYIVQKQKAVVSFDESPLVSNLSNAAVSYVLYIYKTFVPIKLAVFYPFQSNISIFKIVAATMALLVVSICVIRFRKEKPYLLVGWFWYIISLIPVIGIIRVGKQSMADRYSYIPLIGIFILLVWGASESKYIQKISDKIKGTFVALVFTVLIALTWNQVSYWKSSISLFSHALAVTSDNWVALGTLGYDYFKLNEMDRAYYLLNESLKINPKNVMAMYNMGLLNNKRGNSDLAFALFKKIVEIEPDYQMAHYQIGLQLMSRGDTAAVLRQHDILKDLNPQLAQQLLTELQIKRSITQGASP